MLHRNVPEGLLMGRILIVLHRKYLCTTAAETVSKHSTMRTFFSLVPGKRMTLTAKETENTLLAARECLECCRENADCAKNGKKRVLLCEEFQGQANRPKPFMRLTCKTGSQHFGDLNKNLCKGSMWGSGL